MRPTMPLNDSSAVGDPPAPPETCSATLHSHRRLIEQICWGLLRHRQDAEDAAQDTLVRAIASWHRFDAARPLMPWLRRIAVNRCRTKLQQRTRAPQPLPPCQASGVGDGAIPADASRQSESAETLRLVQEQLQQLPEHCRAAFLAIHRDGLTYQQHADAIDRPVGTVKTWVHRTRRRLIDHFEIADRGDR